MITPKKFFDIKVIGARDEFEFLCEAWESKTGSLIKRTQSFVKDLKEFVELGAISQLAISLFLNYYSEADSDEFLIQKFMELLNETPSSKATTKPIKDEPKTPRVKTFAVNPCGAPTISRGSC